MTYDFAALRFTEDGNLRSRVYWYLAPFPVSVWEEVLAPVGPHDRLQKARVERTLSCAEEEAPYDMRLIKRAAAKYGEREVHIGELGCLEFGGIRYDDRHFTRFGAVLLAGSAPAPADLAGEKRTVFVSPQKGDETVYRTLSLGHGILLAGGEGREICRLLLSFVRGDIRAERELRAIGLTEEELSRIAGFLA